MVNDLSFSLCACLSFVLPSLFFCFVGPAGTGKTESVKALASCLGRQVLVFNCDEALESTSMIRIFIGIVKCGAWGCVFLFIVLKEYRLSAN
jgi:dynein heavy chain 2